MAFQLIIGAFADGGFIPSLHTCEGADLLPALEWRGEPAGTKSFALVVDDPDAPAGIWNHCLLYDIPLGWHTLPQGFKPGREAQTGANDFGKLGYGGPCPPKGHGPHRYFFKLLALDVPNLSLRPGAKRAALDRAVEGHILEQAQYMGRYERK